MKTLFLGGFHLTSTEGDWNTYSVEVNQVVGSPSTLEYFVRVDGTQIGTGTYDASGAFSSGDLYAKVSNNLHASATHTSVKNFYYQTFADIPACATDPCAGLSDCTAIVDGCEISPAANTLVATVSAALNYKERVLGIKSVFINFIIDKNYILVYFYSTRLQGFSRSTLQ